jgi:hypothetical protein
MARVDFRDGSDFRLPGRRSPAGTGGARDYRRWVARLAEEYRRDFHRDAALQRARPTPAGERRGAADRAAAVVFAAGRFFWRAGLFLGPLARFVLARSAPILKIAAVGLAVLAAVGVFAQWPRSGTGDGTVKASEPDKPATRAGWVRIAEPDQLYALHAPFTAGERLVYEARRHSAGGGREDFLNYGEFSASAPFVRLAVTRHGLERIIAPAFFVDMARRAAAIGVSIDRADRPAPGATRFGDFEMAAMTMRDGRVARRNCRGFRFNATPPGLGVAGFACGADGQPLSDGDLACLINRLGLVSAGEDKPLTDFFAAAGTRAARGCAAPGPARRRRK